jgi:hypothetical protein
MLGKYCAWVPNTGKEEKEEGSQLFKDLLKFFNNNRGNAKDIFWRTKNPDFIRDYDDVLEKHPTQDDYTYGSLWKHTDLRNWGDSKNDISRLENEYGGRKNNEPTVYTSKTYDKAMSEMRRFNNTAPEADKYISQVVLREDGKYAVVISPKNKRLAVEVSKVEANYNLNRYLADMLASVGVGIEALTDLEKRLGISGVADMELAQKVGETIINAIRVDTGDYTSKALPEEAVHLMVASTKHLPLTKRLIDNIYTNNLARNILGNQYDRYSQEYANNLNALAEEAAGKLITEYLHNDNSFDVNKSFINRVWDFIKSWFKQNLSIRNIRNAMIGANKDARDYARQILTGSITSEIKLQNISTTEKFLNVKAETNKHKELLERILRNEIKKLKVYGNEKTVRFNQRQELLIAGIQADLDSELYEVGTMNFLTNTIETLEQLDKRLVELNDEIEPSAQKRASTLLGIYNFTQSFGTVLDDIRETLREDSRNETPKYNPETLSVLNNVQSLVQGLRVDFAKMATPTVMDIFKPLMSESLLKYVSYDKIQEQLSVVDKDITPIVRMLDAMNANPDIFSGLLDKSVKIAKYDAEQKSWNDIKLIQGAQLELEKAGVKNFEFMVERDENGLPTGNIVDEIDWPKFRKVRKEFYDVLNEIYDYNNSPTKQQLAARLEEIKSWRKQNFEPFNGGYRPKIKLYASDKYRAMSKPQKAYYDAYINIKGRMDAVLPSNRVPALQMPQTRKDLVERLKSSTLSTAGKQTWTAFKENFVRNTDDVDYGDRAVETKEDVTVRLDFSGKEIMSLPTYFTKKLKDMNDLSLDLTSGLAAYISMAHEHYQLYKILDSLELSRLVLAERKVYDTRGGKSKFERSVGDEERQRVVKDPTKVRITKRIDDWFESQVYGRLKRDEGTLWGTNIDRAKFIDAVGSWTSLNMMGGNILMAISNTTTASFMMATEAFAGEFYDMKNIAKADFNYAKDLPIFVSQIGKRVKTNKLDLLNERINILQDFDQRVRGMDMDRKTRFGQLFGLGAVFYMQNAGEHWLQFRSALALMDRIKLVDRSGKKHSLYDSYEVVKKEDGTATLKIKDGYTKEDGAAWTTDDEYKLSRRSIAINENLHGIYNKTDSNALQMTALGRLAMQFRGWIIRPFERRYKGEYFNQDLDSLQEGFYITAGKFALELLKDLKGLQFHVGANWDKLSAHQQANMRRFFSETVMMALLGVLSSIMMKSDDDNDESFTSTMLRYQIMRLATEAGVYTPVGVVPEGFKLLKSPFAAVNTVENIIGLFDMLIPWNWDTFTTEVQSGRFAGHSQAYKRLMTSPLVPMNNTIYKSLHPEEAILFYTQK